nr:DUF692 family multinuclear iron-containing protein [Paludibacterium paludis]
MEVGLAAYKHVFSEAKHLDIEYRGDISLHVARSPITEAAVFQNAFIQEKLAGIGKDARVVSIGFHLCGDRRDNIGAYGFSSHYRCSAGAENRATAFIARVTAATGKPVWIENANFYSASPAEIVANWKSIVRIAEHSGASLIIDLSHLIIDCLNNGVSPDICLGMIPWDSVAELHLSGIVEGRDGALHDGHGSPVDHRVWAMLDTLMRYGLVGGDIYLNIEHSDSAWLADPVAYRADFARLASRLAAPSRTNGGKNALGYARAYLKTLLKNAIVNFDEVVELSGISERELLDGWLSHVDATKKRLALSTEEMDSLIRRESIVFTDTFIDYIESRFNENRD